MSSKVHEKQISAEKNPEMEARSREGLPEGGASLRGGERIVDKPGSGGQETSEENHAESGEKSREVQKTGKATVSVREVLSDDPRVRTGRPRPRQRNEFDSSGVLRESYPIRVKSVLKLNLSVNLTWDPLFKQGRSNF